ncbi:MAG TPA: pirin family protein [Euzebyales bacterium]|nr:pirin family protein [Euzebyales bacterium]
MLTIRRADEIFETDGGWFTARWHFSFDHYHDPQQMGVGALRVFNDDAIIAGAEWPMHPHRDIESLTYVVEGSFAHADSLGNDGVFAPGAAQVMTFSSHGALHSERNGSEDEPLRFIQFWILPSQEGLADGVQQRQYTIEDRTDRWLTIMSPEDEPGLDLHQDARALVTRLEPGADLSHDVVQGRGAYLYVIDGAATLNDDTIKTGDAVKIHGVERLEIAGQEATELILVDVPLNFVPVGVWRGRV